MQKRTEVKEFKLTDDPIIKPNVIIINATDSAHVKQKCIYFPGYRDAKDTEAIKALQAKKTVFFEGIFQPDRRTNQMQFVIDKVSDANKEQAVTLGKYDIDPNLDFTPGGKSSFNNKLITMSEPKEGHRQYFTDGDYYWYPGDTTKCPTVF